MRRRLFVAAVAVILPLFAAAQQAVDLSLVDRIKGEAFARSQVMEHLRELSDVHGPRLTASPEFDDAAKWAMERRPRMGVTPSKCPA